VPTTAQISRLGAGRERDGGTSSTRRLHSNSDRFLGGLASSFSFCVPVRVSQWRARVFQMLREPSRQLHAHCEPSRQRVGSTAVPRVRHITRTHSDGCHSVAWKTIVRLQKCFSFLQPRVWFR
jgi:hypothetical protein